MRCLNIIIILLFCAPIALADITIDNGIIIDTGDAVFNFTQTTTFDDLGIGTNSLTANFGGDNQTLTISGTSLFYITSWTSSTNSFTTTGSGTITAEATNNTLSGTTYYDGNVRSSWTGGSTPTSFRFTFSTLSTQTDEETCLNIKYELGSALASLFGFFSIIVLSVVLVFTVLMFNNGSIDEKMMYTIFSGTIITLVIVAVLLAFGVSIVEESC